MGKKKTSKPNAYSLFVADQAKARGMRMQEAFAACAQAWNDLPEERRQHYKSKEALIKSGARLPPGSKQPVAIGLPHPDMPRMNVREQAEEQLYSDMADWLQRELFSRSAISGEEKLNANRLFVVGHVNYYCKTEHGDVVPAEIALAKFSVVGGVVDVYHKILFLRDMPTGYKFKAQQASLGTHNLPFEDVGLGERDVVKVSAEMADFLGKEPVFCLETEIEDAAKALDGILENLSVPVFNLALLLAKIEASLVETMPDRSNSVATKSAADTLFDQDLFCYKMKDSESCEFHRAVENVKHCSLNIVRRRVYTVCSQSACDFGIGLVEGKHMPSKRQDLAEPDPRYKAMAVVKEFVNVFGAEVPRCGSKGGHIFVNQDMDPGPVVLKMRQANEEKMRTQLSGLNITGYTDKESEWEDHSTAGWSSVTRRSDLDDASSVASSSTRARKSRILAKFGARH